MKKIKDYIKNITNIKYKQELKRLENALNEMYGRKEYYEDLLINEKVNGIDYIRYVDIWNNISYTCNVLEKRKSELFKELKK